MSFSPDTEKHASDKNFMKFFYYITNTDAINQISAAILSTKTGNVIWS